MANSLNRDIEKGEVVVLAKKYFKTEYPAPEDRLFVVDSGFGMNGFTSGRALFGKFLKTGLEVRAEGYMIDAKETEAHQAKHGKFIKKKKKTKKKK